MTETDMLAAGLRAQDIPVNALSRYAVRVGAQIISGRGFRFQTEADRWIESHHRSGAMDWRVGNLFRLRGLGRDLEAVPCQRKATRLQMSTEHDDIVRATIESKAVGRKAGSSARGHVHDEAEDFGRRVAATGGDADADARRAVDAAPLPLARESAR